MKRLTVAQAALSITLSLAAGGCTAPLAGSSTLHNDVENLKREVRALQSQGGGATEMAALRAEVQRLSAELGEPGELRRRLAELSARLDRLEGRSSLAPAPAPASAPGRPAPAPATPYVAPEPEVLNGGPYEEGKALFDRQDFRPAIDQFKNYLRQEPKGANAAAAQFYIGEALFSEKRYEDAILEYQKVVQGFPKSSQVPTSLLKQGQSFQALGEAESAKLLYRKVVNNYSKSYAAEVAKGRLKDLQ